MAQLVPIIDINEGMILSEPILNNYGQILIPAGTKLGENHKKILKIWNIHTVSIKSDKDEMEVEISKELEALAIERLSKRMHWKPRNVYEEDLFRMGIIRAVKIILKK